MDKRKQDLNHIRNYIQNIDKELTLLLQNLQWDHKHIKEQPRLSKCSINLSHRMPEGSRYAHQQHCFLTHHGYTKDDQFLPDPVDITSNTLVQLSTQDIQYLISSAAHSDPTFKRVLMLTFLAKHDKLRNRGPEPLTVERLHSTYTADERRAIHDAVVNAAPFAHDLADLALGSNSREGNSKSKSRAEVMAELRDLRRRRAKYRVPSKTTNYSHVLKGVIKSQMDLYAETSGIFMKTEYGSKSFVSLNDDQSLALYNNTAPKLVIKQERISPELNNTRNRDRPNIQGKDMYEGGNTSRDRERHTHTRHIEERDARSNDYSRRKHREENIYERKLSDHRNDTDEKYNERRNENAHDKLYATRDYRNDPDKKFDKYKERRSEQRLNKYPTRDYRNDSDNRFDMYKERRNEQRHDKYLTRDHRNDSDDRCDMYKERRNEQRHDKYPRSKIQEKYKNDKNDRPGTSNRERYDRSKECSSSRSDRDKSFDRSYQKVRVKEEKDDSYERRKKRKYH